MFDKKFKYMNLEERTKVYNDLNDLIYDNPSNLGKVVLDALYMGLRDSFDYDAPNSQQELILKELSQLIDKLKNSDLIE